MKCEQCLRTIHEGQSRVDGCTYCYEQNWVVPSTLIPNEKNPRKITKAQVRDLVRSIEFSGFVELLVINQHPDRMNIIVSGHQRLKAAKILKMRKLPVSYVNVPENKESILNIGLNATGGSFDDDKLQVLLKHIMESDEDVTLTGFDEPAIDEMMSNSEESRKNDTEDIVPEAPKKTISKEGDVWELGIYIIKDGKQEDVELIK